MNRINGVSFKGNIKIDGVVSNNDLCRYALNQLEKNCGGEDVIHFIDPKNEEEALMVFTKFLIDKIKGTTSFSTIKKIVLTSKDDIDKKISELNLWIQDRVKQSA